MIKRILNNLLGNSNNSMKTHTINDVREVLYSLIAQNQSTTTLDVKNELRRLGFQAFQDQVSQMVNTIVLQDNLSSRNNGKFNIYSFGQDTSEVKHVYMELGQEFWEAKAEKKSLILFNGKVGTDGKEEQIEFYKNSLAIRELNHLITEKTQQGFSQATDLRPPLKIRQKYGHLLSKKPLSCSIGYFNVSKKEQVANQVLTKNSGYTFTWNITQSRQDLTQVLSQPTWNNTTIKYDNAQLLGEKILKREPSGIIFQTAQLEVDNAHIFQIELSFETGEKAVFSKFGMDMQKAVLPLVKQFIA
jgi:predicted DNA-binding WGR domain protein